MVLHGVDLKNCTFSIDLAVFCIFKINIILNLRDYKRTPRREV
jgi:hypothetical protein